MARRPKRDLFSPLSSPLLSSPLLPPREKERRCGRRKGEMTKLHQEFLLPLFLPPLTRRKKWADGFFSLSEAKEGVGWGSAGGIARRRKRRRKRRRLFFYLLLLFPPLVFASPPPSPQPSEVPLPPPPPPPPSPLSGLWQIWKDRKKKAVASGFFCPVPLPPLGFSTLGGGRG